jgi:hypothetical protein
LPNSSLTPICFDCAHMQGVQAGIGWVCSAYPDGIPTEILASKHDHRLSYQGDHGITFSPKHEQNALGEDSHEYTKFKKEAVLYKPHASDREHACQHCNFFDAPSSCALVEGYISPDGWCINWAVKGQDMRRARFALAAGHSFDSVCEVLNL